MAGWPQSILRKNMPATKDGGKRKTLFLGVKKEKELSICVHIYMSQKKKRRLEKKNLEKSPPLICIKKNIQK